MPRIKKINDKDLTYIDLFAGCGGLSLGLEQAGFMPVYVNELNKDALETYLTNRDDEYSYLREKYFSMDIKDVICTQDGLLMENSYLLTQYTKVLEKLI